MTRSNLLAVQVFVLFLILSNSAAYADPFTFTFNTIPGTGNVSGPAGSTVGWGYSITNTSTKNWLVTDAINAGTFKNGTPLAIFDLPILAPGATANVAFDAAKGSGLYELTWNASAPAGFVNSGNFVLSTEWWNGNPLAGGSFLTSAADQIAPYTATVTALPVPSTLLLMAVGLAALCLMSTHPWRLSP